MMPTAKLELTARAAEHIDLIELHRVSFQTSDVLLIIAGITANRVTVTCILIAALINFNLRPSLFIVK